MGAASHIVALPLSYLFKGNLRHHNSYSIFVGKALETTPHDHWLHTLNAIIIWDNIYDRVEFLLIWAIEFELELSFISIAPVTKAFQDAKFNIFW